MNRYCRLLYALSVLILSTLSTSAQLSNNDPSKGAINITLPKTPESAAFEKYGSVPVSEVTGSPNIAVPIYTLKSRFWEVPISLTYDASGVKVSQEATWVGLGFNLNAGGRITVETRGSIDKDNKWLYSDGLRKWYTQKFFNRLGAPNGLSVLTFATGCWECEPLNIPDSVPDHWGTFNAMAQFGVGEPDIYRANFNGNSLTFYFNAITDSLEFIGEKSMIDIALSKDANDNILTWTVKDNSGNIYFFNQRESTTMTLPPLGPLQNNTATSAWLLTKMLHPSGDSIVYTYTNYGNSYPVTPKSASMSFLEDGADITHSNENQQNEVIQAPQYLTKIESNNTSIEFQLGSRTDIKGAGSKRLDVIRVKDKISNTYKKKTSFTYSYFNGSLSGCFSTLHDSITSYYRLRLKLTDITVQDSSSLQPPYKFYYNPYAVPNKHSVAQDHWGYHNINVGTAADPCSPRNLIPNTGAGDAVNRPELNGYAFSRECYAPASLTMSMDSIVYPTGGSTKFFYEPHQTTSIAITGAGLRIKSIRNYLNARLTGTFNYTYNTGTYLGSINYLNISYAFSACNGGSESGDTEKLVVSSNGVNNDADMLVAYNFVQISETDERGRNNGYKIKIFNVPNPRYSTGGYGYNVMAAHWPTGIVCDGPSCITYQNSTGPLYPGNTPFSPTATRQLDAKLLEEKVYNSANVLLKSTNYYYHQAAYTEKFYSVRIVDNQVGTTCTGLNEYTTFGARRLTAFVSPSKSFYTLTDSVVEKSYLSGNTLIQRNWTKYNSFFQPETQITFNSDGSQTIANTKTSLDLAPKYPLSPTGDALSLSALKTAHIYDLPIEQTKLIRTTSGDTLVTESRLNIYENKNLKKVYQYESASPLVYRSQFVPIYYTYAGYPNSPSGSSYSLQMDSRYKLNATAYYSNRSQLLSVKSTTSNSAYIWDDFYDDMLAQASNADSTEIAYTSFETAAKGRWTFNAAGKLTDATSPTGSFAYSMTTGGNITLSGLSTTKPYLISYWRKNSSGTQTVNTTSGTTGLVANGWTYVQHIVNNPTGGTITISGTGTIDELRLYPKNATMTSYTYTPVFGLISQSDPTNRLNYYEYDGIGRLARIRDINRNVIKQIGYKYGDVFTFPHGNQERTSTAQKACATGYASSVPYPYKVPANTYGSFINVSDANNKADRDIAANGQWWADSIGSCVAVYDFSSPASPTAFSVLTDNFGVTGPGSVVFQYSVAKNGAWVLNTMYHVGNLTGALFVPTTIVIINVSGFGSTYQMTVFPDGKVYLKWTGGSAPASNVASVSGNYTF